MSRLMTPESSPSPWTTLRIWLRSVVTLRGSVLPLIAPLILLFACYSVLVVLVWQNHWPMPMGVFGELTNSVVYNLVLGLLLVFRTNSSYDRYWEGRKAWGDIVVNVRNLARTMQLCIPATDALAAQRRHRILQMLPGFALAMKLHLRDVNENQELAPYFHPDELHQLAQTANRPLHITLWIQDYLQQEFQQGRIDTARLWELNQLLNALIQGLTACERIRQTPIPPAYLIYLRRLILVYCLCLPFVLVPKLGWWTVLVTSLVGFMLLGIEELGREIQDPFGFDPNDLPLDVICRTLTDNVNTIAGINPPDNTPPMPLNPPG
ncbi:MAG: bestrophin family ion channel, partial [Gloeomargarita sp. DG02_5_bins_242]